MLYTFKTNKNDQIDTCLSQFNRRHNVLLAPFKHTHAHLQYILFNLLHAIAWKPIMDFFQYQLYSLYNELV